MIRDDYSTEIPTALGWCWTLNAEQASERPVLLVRIDNRLGIGVCFTDRPDEPPRPIDHGIFVGWRWRPSAASSRQPECWEHSSANTMAHQSVVAAYFTEGGECFRCEIGAASKDDYLGARDPLGRLMELLRTDMERLGDWMRDHASGGTADTRCPPRAGLRSRPDCRNQCRR